MAADETRCFQGLRFFVTVYVLVFFPVAGSSLFFADCSEFFERFIWADDKLFDFFKSGHLSAKVYFLI